MVKIRVISLRAVIAASQGSRVGVGMNMTGVPGMKRFRGMDTPLYMKTYFFFTKSYTCRAILQHGKPAI